MLLHILGSRENHNQRSDFLLYTCLSVTWQKCRDPNIEETVLGSLDLFRFYIYILKIHLKKALKLKIIRVFCLLVSF